MGVKTSRVLLPLAERSEDTHTPAQLDTVAESLRFYLCVVNSPGSGGLQVVLRGYDKASRTTVELTGGGEPVTAEGTYCYEVTNYPSDAVFGRIRESAARAVPYEWDALVKHADGASFVYSLSVEIVK